VSIIERHYTLTIPYESPSANRMRGVHWSKISSANLRIGEIIRAVGGNELREHAAWVALHKPFTYLQILSMRCALIHDRVNLESGCKGLVDQLKKAGLMVDDSVKQCSDTYLQQLADLGVPRNRLTNRRRRIPRTEITFYWKAF